MKLDPSLLTPAMRKRNPHLFPAEQKASGQGVEHEIRDLHGPIMKWCREQVPAVPYIRARSDTESTIAPGANDFTIFYRGRVLLIECKGAKTKVRREQAGWHLLMHLQGFKVHVIRTMAEFYALVAPQTSPDEVNL